MAITSYSTLKSAISAWTHRADLASVLDDFIDLTEARLNRELRVSQQETNTTLTATETIDFPTGLLELRNIKLNTTPVRELLYITPAEMDRLDTTGEETSTYTIVGNQIRLNAASDTDIAITYYAKIPALSDSNTSNWLLEAHAEVYLYGCLAEAYAYAMDDANEMKYRQLFAEGVAGIKRLDSYKKSGQSMYVRVA